MQTNPSEAALVAIERIDTLRLITKKTGLDLADGLLHLKRPLFGRFCSSLTIVTTTESMTSIANGILTTAVSVLLDKAAQTRVKSSPKQGVIDGTYRAASLRSFHAGSTMPGEASRMKNASEIACWRNGE